MLDNGCETWHCLPIKKRTDLPSVPLGPSLLHAAGGVVDQHDDHHDHPEHVCDHDPDQAADSPPRPNEPDSVSPAEAVGWLLAPVVACLRGDDDGFAVLVGAAIGDGIAPQLVRVAPRVTRVYLHLAPPPDGADQIVRSFGEVAVNRFDDAESVAVGAECLHAAHAVERLGAEFGRIIEVAFVSDALSHDEFHALEGSLASVWWAAASSAALRGADPIEEAAAVCRYAARLAA
jgi:hypothetical protein